MQGSMNLREGDSAFAVYREATLREIVNNQQDVWNVMGDTKRFCTRKMNHNSKELMEEERRDKRNVRMRIAQTRHRG